MSQSASGTPPAPGVFGRAIQAVRYAITGLTPDTWMGPNQPLAPMAVDTKGRAYDYRVGSNLNFIPRSPEKITFARLRNLAENADIIRMIIERQKDLIEGVEWTIKPVETDVGKRPPNSKYASEIADLTAFFKFPDQVHDFGQWIRILAEEVFVTDALSVYKQRNRAGGIYALQPIDGASIKVLIDGSGRRPVAPNPAYQQILKGIPSSDYSADELLYYPKNPRVNRLYGMPPVQFICHTGDMIVARTRSQEAFFTSGNMTDFIMTGPTGMTTAEIKDWQIYWDSLFMGNIEGRRGGLWTPPGTDVKTPKAPTLKDDFDEWLTRLTCFALSTSPTPFIKQMNRATAESQQEVAEEGGIAIYLGFFKRLIDRFIQIDFQKPYLELCWLTDEEFDPAVQDVIDDRRLKNGSALLNEVRDRRGEDPLPGGDVPMVLTLNGYVLINPIDPLIPPSAGGAGGGVALDEGGNRLAPDIGTDGLPAPSATQGGKPAAKPAAAAPVAENPKAEVAEKSSRPKLQKRRVIMKV